MNFSDLQNIVHEIQETIACRDCNQAFSERDIRIIGTVFNEVYFMTHCSHCKGKLIINVVLKSKKRRHRKIRKDVPQIQAIDQNDILDIHNFLKDFDGDFNKLFGEKKTS